MEAHSFHDQVIATDFGARLILCPGTGPVDDATEAEAVRNIAQFIADSGDQAIHDGLAHLFGDRPTYRALSGLCSARLPERDERGRFGFLLTTPDGRSWEVQMPGLPLEQVRYLKRPEQSIWSFPRLYVDGSSWVWCFGLLHAGSRVHPLRDHEDEE